MWDGSGWGPGNMVVTEGTHWTPVVSSHWAHIYIVTWEDFTLLEGGPNMWHRNLGWQDSLSRNDLTHNEHGQSTLISPQEGRRACGLTHQDDQTPSFQRLSQGNKATWGRDVRNQLQGSVKQSSVRELQPYLVVFNIMKTLQMFSSLKILGIRSCSIFPCSWDMSWEPQNSKETGVFNHRPGTTLTAFCRKFPETIAEQQGLQQAGYPASSQQRNTRQPLWPGLWMLGTRPRTAPPRLCSSYQPLPPTSICNILHFIQALNRTEDTWIQHGSL